MKKPNVSLTGNNLSADFSEANVIDAIKTIYDPEIPVNIYDMGLIYSIKINKKIVDVNMTLTSPTCPMADEIPVWVAEAISKIDGLKKINIFMVWEPAWDLSKMSDNARFELDLFNTGW